MLKFLHLSWLMLPFFLMADDPGTGGGGAAAGAWHSSIPSEYSGHAALSSFKNDKEGLGNLAKSYVEASKKLSEPVIARINFKDEGTVKQIRTMMGYPDKPEGYGLQDANFAAAAYKHGLTSDQVKGFHADLAAAGSKIAETRAAERKAAADALKTSTEAALKTKFGAKYEAEKALIDKAFGNDKFFSKDLRDKLMESGLIHHPDLALLANMIGKASQEGGLLSGTGAPPSESDMAANYSKQVEFEGKMSQMQKQKGFDPTSSQWQELLRQRNEYRTAVSKAKVAKLQAGQGGPA